MQNEDIEDSAMSQSETSENPNGLDYAAQRMNICMSCDRLFKTTRQCKECGCFMKIKVRLKNASCPLDKWQALN